MMDLRIARGAAAATVAAGLVLLSSCSSGASNDTTGSASSVTVTSTVASSSAATTATPTLATSSSPSAAPSSSTPPTTTSNPWPADFTPEQAAAAQAAIETYQNAVRVTDEAYADPSNPDIETLIRKYIADPRAAQIVRAAGSMAQKGNRTTGSTIAEVKATGILANRITLEVCTDTSQADYVDSTGKSIRAQLPVGNRVKQTANVYDYGAPNGWLLSEIEQSDPAQPC